MRTLEDQMLAYGAYHRDGRNKATHFVGVPLVTFSILIPMAWFHFVFVDRSVPFSAATIFFLVVGIYYLRLDWRVALLQLPVNFVLLMLAERVAALPFAESVGIFLAAFVLGWIIQLLGHYFEGRKPALVDNMSQIFNAPLFLTVEVLFLLGLRKDLRKRLEMR